MGEGILGLALGFVGILAAVYFWARPRRYAKLKYATYSVNLVKDLESQLEGLAVTYDGMQVKTLTVTKLAFWNAGSEPLDREDIRTKDPLHVVVVPQAEQWDVDVVSAIPDATGTKLAKLHPTDDGNMAVRVDFDFLNPGQGGIIQIIHTGTSGQQVSMGGTMKGAGVPVRVKPTRGEAPLLLAAMGGSLVVAVSAALLVPRGRTFSAWATAAILAGLGLASVVVYLVARWVSQRFDRRFPSSFKDAFEQLPGPKAPFAE